MDQPVLSQTFPGSTCHFSRFPTVIGSAEWDIGKLEENVNKDLLDDHASCLDLRKEGRITGGSEC